MTPTACAWGRVTAWMAFLFVFAIPASAGATERCPTPTHTELVMRSAKLAVFRRDTKPPVGEFGTISTWAACWRPTGRRTTLVQIENIYAATYGNASFFRVSGRYVAFLTSGGTHYGDRSDYLNLANARTGRNYVVAEVGYVPAFYPLLGNQLLALRLTDGGFLGWKVLLASGDSAIYAHDSRGNRLLDSTPAHFGPLGLAGERLTWSLGEDQRSAPLR